MKSNVGFLVIPCILLTGCLTARPNFNPPQITQLQARAIQTRIYQGLDQKTVLKTVLNVLQDEGFIVHYGDTDLGLLNASKILVEGDKTNYFGQFDNQLGNTNAVANPVSTIDATANVSGFGQRIKVRVNFQRKVVSSVSSTFGSSNERTLDVNPINDPKFYQEFFVKVDKGLFIQQQGL